MKLEAPVVISLLAFGVSIASLTVALLSYFRDRSKIRAWSKIAWHFNGPEPEIPYMHVYVANVGRRPVLVLNLVKRAGTLKWWRSIQPPSLSKGSIESIEQLQELRQKSLAQHVAVKLAEGEILELVFQSNSCSEFVATHEDPPVEATELQIEDISGRLYPVKDSAKSLSVLFKAWHP